MNIVATFRSILGPSGEIVFKWLSFAGGEPLPSQGFEGKLVAHADTVTQTSDWYLDSHETGGQ